MLFITPPNLLELQRLEMAQPVFYGRGIDPRRLRPDSVRQRIMPHVTEPIAQLQRQLDQFRSAQPGRTKLPESLWQAAVELAREHGVYSVAHPLRLDYMRLKKQVDGPPTLRQKKATKATFVEPILPALVQLEECVIELECPGGNKMRIQWKTTAPPDWTNLLRAWRDVKR
jgi:hypothetical protein